MDIFFYVLHFHRVANSTFSLANLSYIVKFLRDKNLSPGDPDENNLK
jgi:hypothetical protein